MSHCGDSPALVHVENYLESLSLPKGQEVSFVPELVQCLDIWFVSLKCSARTNIYSLSHPDSSRASSNIRSCVITIKGHFNY